MTFDAVAYINEPRWQKVSLGLERTHRLMDLLGHPERSFASVHVAGTNGKGSTCAYLAATCHAAGLKTGLFTSPFIHRFEERIRIDGIDISPDELRTCTLDVKAAAETVEREMGEHPTEFELMFAVAALHFARRACDICIIEVGLGGRLDATNVIPPTLSIITRIGVDHAAILGDTLEEIAQEKAGIVKPGVPCVTCEQKPEALHVIERTCDNQGSPLTVIPSKDVTDAHLTPELTRAFRLQGEAFTTLLLGAYQPENASLAIMGARMLRTQGWDISEGSIRCGIAEATWPGRFEVLKDHPLIIVDGAHNADGSLALAASLDELEEARPSSERIYVIGVLKDKDVRRIISPHLPRARTCFLYAPPNPRTLPAEELAALASKLSPHADVHICASPAEAMEQALKKAAPESTIIAFGSLYSIADIKSALGCS